MPALAAATPCASALAPPVQVEQLRATYGYNEVKAKQVGWAAAAAACCAKP